MNKKICLFLLILIVLAGTIALIVSLVLTNQNQNNNNNENIKNIQKTKNNKNLVFPIMQNKMYEQSGNFEDVVYYCPQTPPKTFQRMLAMEQKNEKIIAASNSFLTDENFNMSINPRNLEYEKLYGMYGGIEKTFQVLKTSQIDIHITNKVTMISNSFTGTNSGHDLGTLFATLIYINENNLDETTLGINELGFKFPRILEILELFYGQDQWLIIELDKKYHFESIDFVRVSPRFIIEEYKNPNVVALVEKIKTRAHFYNISQGLDVPKNSKIILIKQVHNTSARTHDSFEGAKFLETMNAQGWIILNPEFDDMRYMIALFSSASHILVSFGSIMWTHMLFFNPLAKIIHLQIGSEVAYQPVLEMKYFTRILMKDTYLDGDTNKDLISQINKLF